MNENGSCCIYIYLCIITRCLVFQISTVDCQSICFINMDEAAQPTSACSTEEQTSSQGRNAVGKWTQESWFPSPCLSLGSGITEINWWGGREKREKWHPLSWSIFLKLWSKDNSNDSSKITWKKKTPKQVNGYKNKQNETWECFWLASAYGKTFWVGFYFAFVLPFAPPSCWITYYRK